MAIEREGGLESKGIAGTEPDGAGTELNEQPPKHRSVLASDKELKTKRLSGISSSANTFY